MPETVKQRGRGRPRKDAAQGTGNKDAAQGTGNKDAAQGTGNKDAAQGTGKRPRGRPRKNILPAAEETTSTDAGDVVPTRQEPEDCNELDLSRFQQLFDDDEDDDGNDEAAVMEMMNDLRAVIHEPTVDAFPIRDSAVSVPHAIDTSNAFPFGNPTVSLPHPMSQGPMRTFAMSNAFHVRNSTVSLPHPMSQGPMPTFDMSNAFHAGNSTVSLPHDPMPMSNAFPGWDLAPHDPVPTFGLSNAFAVGEVAESLPQFMSAGQKPSSNIDYCNWGSLSNAFPVGFARWLQGEDGGQFKPVEPLVAEPLAVKEPAMEILPRIDSSDSPANLVPDSKRDSPEVATSAGAGNAIIATKRPREDAVPANWDSTVSDREGGYQFEPEPAMEDLSTMVSTEKSGDSLVSDSITKKRPRGRPRKVVSPESLTGDAGNAVITKRPPTQPCEKAVAVREEPEDCNKWDLARFQQLFAEGYNGEDAVMEKEDGYNFEPEPSVVEPAMEDPSTMDSSEKNSAGYFVSDSITKKNPRGRPRKRVSPESVTGNAGNARNSGNSGNSGNAGDAVITTKRARVPPRKYAETVREEPKDCNKLAPAGNAVITEKRPRGRPCKKAVTVREEPEDCNNLDPARLDEVAAMFKVNNCSEPPVDVNNAVSLHQKPSNNDISNEGSTEGYHEEVTVMEKHDEVAVMEKVDDYSEPPVELNDAVSLPHVMSEVQKPSSDMNDDIANGDSTGSAEGYHDEVAVVEKVIEYSEPPVDVSNAVRSPHLMFELQKLSSDIHDDIANGGSTGFAEGWQDEVAVLGKVIEYSEPPVDVKNAVSLPQVMSEDQKPSSGVNNDGGSTVLEDEAEGYHDEAAVTECSEPAFDVNNAVSLPHLMSEDQEPIVDIFTWDSTGSLPHLIFEDQYPPSVMNNEIVNGGPTGFAEGYHDEVEVMEEANEYSEPTVDMDNAVSLPHEDQVPAVDISVWDYTVSLPHLICEDQRPSSEMNNDIASGGSIVDLPDQKAMDMYEDQRPSSGTIDDFANGGSAVDLPDQEAVYMCEDQRPSSDMHNDTANGVSTGFAEGYHDEVEMMEKANEYSEPAADLNNAVSLPHEDQMPAVDISVWDYTVSLPHLMCEDQRPSSDMNNDIASGGSIVDLPDQEAMDMYEDQRPSSGVNDDFANGGSAVDLPDQECVYMCEDQRPSSDMHNDTANAFSTGFAEGYHDEVVVMEKANENSEPAVDLNNAVSLPHEDQMPAIDISVWDYTVSLPHLMCEDQRPSSDMNSDIASGGSIVDLSDQEAMDMYDDQRPSSGMNDDFANGGSDVDFPDQECVYMCEDQRPSSDMNNDIASGGSIVDLFDQEAMDMYEYQRPSGGMNDDFANGGSAVDLPDQEALYMFEDQRPSSDMNNAFAHGGSTVGLPDQEATDNAFPDSNPISNDFGNVGLLDQVAMENAFPVMNFPDDNQNNYLEQAEGAIRYETPEVFSVEPWGFEELNSHENDGDSTHFVPIQLQELPLALDLNTFQLPYWLMRNEDMNYTDRELSPLWTHER